MTRKHPLITSLWMLNAAFHLYSHIFRRPCRLYRRIDQNVISEVQDVQTDLKRGEAHDIFANMKREQRLEHRSSTPHLRSYVRLSRAPCVILVNRPLWYCGIKLSALSGKMNRFVIPLAVN